jgi:hypothetical protein
VLFGCLVMKGSVEKFGSRVPLIFGTGVRARSCFGAFRGRCFKGLYCDLDALQGICCCAGLVGVGERGV